MAERIHFYMDVHISRAVAVGLRRRGIDVVRAQEVGLDDASDDEHLKHAFQERRMIVTHDAGFLARIARNEANYGVAYCAQNSRSIGEMIAALELIYEVLERDQVVGRAEYL